MKTNTNTQTMGVYTPQKRPLFSTTIVEKCARIRIVNNAPQLEQAIRRTRAD